MIFNFFYFAIRRWIPNFNTVCSANLLNLKVLVPCYPTDYLNNEYGEWKNWIIPKSKDYKWTNLERNYSTWSEADWPYAIKYFNSNGKLNFKNTLNYIKKNTNLSINELPDDVLERYQ